MEYFYKYKKYKLKYIRLKLMSQNGGSNTIFNGNPLFHKDKGIKFTKKDLQAIKDGSINFYCHNDKPYLCTSNSKSFGLCKENPSDCDDVNLKGDIPIIPDTVSDEGKNHGYSTENLHVRCLNKVLNYNETFHVYRELPTSFKIMTYNIWGLLKMSKNDDYNDFQKEMITIRMNGIIKEILKQKPDIICFQEMSNVAYQSLVPLFMDYPFRYETNFDIERDFKERNRDVEVYVFSKFPALKVRVYSINGNLHYNDSFMIVDFPQVNVYNCYLQSGSKKSPGQENYWYHYSRCRRDQLRQIKRIIDDENKPVIVCGDFNCHLDGTFEDWDELNEIKGYFCDSFRQLNPFEPGFTEDTSINIMRWNLKFIKKKLRYDGILYRGKTLKPIESRVVGKRVLPLSKQNSLKFKKFMTPEDPENNKLIYWDKKLEQLALFPSDHFAVITTFNLSG
jgi:exonuclease III